ncbi:MAG: hypothetical protein IKX74_02845 [Erysipelotrichaceae bacterium]|nr:hypothetical protein [Erysipelotrichaceae bacterium]
MKKVDYQKIYELLNRREILDFDCGLLCSAACCRPDGCYDEAVINEDYLLENDDEEMGIFLFPGEEKMSLPRDWQSSSLEDAQAMGFPASWEAVCFVSCGGKKFCQRHKRPMQCRTFPFCPHLNENNELSLIYYPDELPYRCPIIEERIPVNKAYLKDLLEAWQLMLEDPRIYELVREDSRQRVSEQLPVEAVISAPLRRRPEYNK